MTFSPTQRSRLDKTSRLHRLLDRLSDITPRRKRSGEVRRIGVLVQWGIGDAVLSAPLLFALRDNFPGASIELIGKPFLADIFGVEVGIGPFHRLVPPWTAPARKYHLWDRSWRQYASDLLALRKISFDLLISPRLDPRDSVQSRLLTAKSVVGLAAAGGRRWFTTDVPLSAETVHTTSRIVVNAIIARLLTGVEIDPIPALTSRRIPPELAQEFVRHGRRAGPLLAVSFGAGNPIRSWDRGKIESVLESVADLVGLIVMIADPDDCNEPLKAPNDTPTMLWRGSLASVMDVLQAVDLLFCADSGLMHIAAALGKRTAAVFGPTSPSLFGPSGSGHEVVLVEPLSCRPCYDQCVRERVVCMEDLSAEMVATRLQNALKRLIRATPSE